MTVTGTVTDEQGSPLAGVSIVIKGTREGTISNDAGNYSIRASAGQTLQFRYLGTLPQERIVGDQATINVQLRRTATTLNTVVITALGQTAAKRSIGTAQQTVSGANLAGTQREDFINAMQGRVAGVDVTSTSGVPGASTSITIRGVSSISSSNQPLMIIDGLPMDNTTLNTANLPSDAPTAAQAFNNRGIDFTNRAQDINPEDIQSITVLKGPEAAALYGIDAANGAIVITTKRGQVGGGFQYNNSFRVEKLGDRPEIQHVYQPSARGSTSFLYYGSPYPDSTTFYDNISGFFQTAFTQKHNLAFSGAAPDNRVNYRISAGLTRQEGVVPGSKYDRINLTGASQGKVNDWLSVDLSMMYSNDDNDQTFKGAGGPLLGLLVWPSTDNAKVYLTPSGQKREYPFPAGLSVTEEMDDPYFSVNKNKINSKVNRILANASLTVAPFSWGNLKTILGTDTYTNQNYILRHPESTWGVDNGGILDQADVVTRNLNEQTLLNFNPFEITKSLSISGMLGHAVSDEKSVSDGLEGSEFLDPNFSSMNNTALKLNRTVTTQRRLVSAFGQAVLDYNHYLYLTLQGRNDWTSTIPKGANSFFYPSITSSFVFSDAFPSIGRHMTGKLRAAYAEVGRDAAPYSYLPTLENQTTSYGGYSFGFYGPNPKLKPEFAHSYEIGTELGFFDDRLGLDATYYRKTTTNQIVQNIRGSYATGFILLNLNGADTRNHGVELTLRGTPVQTRNFTWNALVNFEHSEGKVLRLRDSLPESYQSDTWLYGNVRSGTAPGLSTLSLTGQFYLRNKDGKVLIDPTTGLPVRSPDFIDAGYDRQPDFTMGISNTFRYKHFTLDFLLDVRKGGDVFNATEHYLTVRGLSPRTLDRNTPRVIDGVLRDGLQNTDHPTKNNIVVVPSEQIDYYLGMSEEQFIEKDINWLRLRDITLSYDIPQQFLKNASVFITGTDLFLITNYTGMDPVVNGNTAAVGGAGGVGIDFGNFPMPRGVNFGLRMGF